MLFSVSAIPVTHHGLDGKVGLLGVDAVWVVFRRRYGREGLWSERGQFRSAHWWVEALVRCLSLWEVRGLLLFRFVLPEG